MKTFILGIGLVLVVAMSLGCDENNNVIAQEPGLMDPGPMDPGPSVPQAMTMVTGKIIPSGDECKGSIGAFALGDEIIITMNGGNSMQDVMASGKVENMTSGNSVDCGGGTTIMDTPLLSILVCSSKNSQIPAFKDGDFMTMLVDYSWVESFKNNIAKSAYILNVNIDSVDDLDLKNVPCARVMIETLTVGGQ